VRVFVYSTGADTGGQGYRIAQGFKRYAPDWTLDALNGSKGKLGYPEQHDLSLSLRKQAARGFYQAADVVHLRNHLAGWEAFDNGQGKPVVLHHHGTMFRRKHVIIHRYCQKIGVTELAATLDLTLLGHAIQWMPSPYDLDELAAIRRKGFIANPDRIRIGHFPTDAKVKSTEEFVAAIDSLKSKGYPIDVFGNYFQHGRRIKARVIAWDDVLRMKARCDLFYDQAVLGYGNNAIESMAMGIPTIAGVADPKVRDLMLERFGTLPFVETTPETIEATLERLIKSEQMQREYREIGLAHVKRWHDSAVVVPMLQAVYRDAKPTRAQAA